MKNENQNAQDDEDYVFIRGLVGEYIQSTKERGLLPNLVLNWT